MLPLESIAVLSACVEMFFLGLYTILWVRHMVLIIRKGLRTRRFIILLALSATMYIAALLHACLMVYRVIHGINLAPDANAQMMWLFNLTHWHIRTISVLQFMQTVAGDLILAFRTYVAWSYNVWVIALSSPLFLLGLVTGGLSLMPTTPSPFLILVVRICLPASLAYNLTMTVLLIWRLGAVHAESARAGVRDATRPPALLRIARVVAETGALYVGTYALFIALNFTGRMEMFIVQSALMPIGGMTFSLMSIRLYGIADEQPDPWTWPSPTIWLKSGTTSEAGLEVIDDFARDEVLDRSPADHARSTADCHRTPLPSQCAV